MELIKHCDHPWERYPRLILFDGVCNFCNASVDFVIQRDPEQKFMFGTLQSEPGQQILQMNHLDTQDFETFLYLENGKVFTKSTAALRVAKELTGGWPLLYICMSIPQIFRDRIYRFIRRRRYQWMGKRDSCRLPDEHERARFV